MMRAHCKLLMAPVPLSVNRSMSTSSAGIRNMLNPAARTIASRSCGVRICNGSTTLIRKGSMMGFMTRASSRHEIGVAELARVQVFGILANSASPRVRFDEALALQRIQFDRGAFLLGLGARRQDGRFVQTQSGRQAAKSGDHGPHKGEPI